MKKAVLRAKVLKPKINNPKLTNEIIVTDENKKKIKVHSVVERPLTLFLNDQEIVTMMTICDYPKYLAIGYLLNQNMLKKNDKITGIDYDEEISTVVVRTKIKTNYEEKLKKKLLHQDALKEQFLAISWKNLNKLNYLKLQKSKLHG